MELAKEFINTTDMSISEICFGVGYTSRSYFSKLFFNRFGILPKDYKNSFVKNNLLFEVSYRSMAKIDLQESDIENILTKAKSYNQEHGITGCLLYHRNVFFQLIEGPKKEVLKLYDFIKNDNRHFDVETMWRGSKPSRDFGDWEMSMLSDDANFNISNLGDTKELNLEHLMGEIDSQSIVSQNLWRKVRKILKVSSE